MSDASRIGRDRMHLGVLLWPQNTTWPDLLETARLVDSLGFDSIWTWDHLLPVYGPAEGDYFESWQILAAWGALTTRVRVGALVSAATLRSPGLLAKMATTLDHITGGRAVLGLGAGWLEAEHVAFGLPFGTPGVRVSRLEEAAAIVRSLLDEPRTTHAGRHYTIVDAAARPKPLQRRLPLLIGGTGEKRTLRIVARHADMWHHQFTTPETFARTLGILRRHCEDVGRDPAEILPLTGAYVLVHDGPDIDVAIEHWGEALARTHRAERARFEAPIAGTPDAVAERLAAYWTAGARGFVIGMGAPFDHETLRRVAREVRPCLDEITGQ